LGMATTLRTPSTVATSSAENCEGQITTAARAPVLLAGAATVRRVVVRTLRSPYPGTTRLPAHILTDGTIRQRRAAARVAYRGADCVHRLDLRLPPGPDGEILTVHDVVSWRFPDEAVPPSVAAEEARRAAVVICPSQFSADEVATVLGVRNVVAIPNGVAPDVFGARPLSEERLAALGLRRPFVLHAGGCTRRKNLQALAAAWPAIRRARPATELALVGPADPRRNELFAGLPGAVLLGRLPRADLLGLLASAAAVVVPSIYEGFGLPALEAMAAGVPVVAARTSSLPEVCGDAALLVEPTEAALVEGLVYTLDGGADIEDLRRRGRERSGRFTWEASAEAHAAIWRSHLI
jgi:glycosyltransferase involved in cell wall biosynthesis